MKRGAGLLGRKKRPWGWSNEEEGERWEMVNKVEGRMGVRFNSNNDS